MKSNSFFALLCRMRIHTVCPIEVSQNKCALRRLATFGWLAHFDTPRLFSPAELFALSMTPALVWTESLGCMSYAARHDAPPGVRAQEHRVPSRPWICIPPSAPLARSTAAADDESENCFSLPHSPLSLTPGTASIPQAAAASIGGVVSAPSPRELRLRRACADAVNLADGLLAAAHVIGRRYADARFTQTARQQPRMLRTAGCRRRCVAYGRRKASAAEVQWLDEGRGGRRLVTSIVNEAAKRGRSSIAVTKGKQRRQRTLLTSSPVCLHHHVRLHLHVTPTEAEARVAAYRRHGEVWMSRSLSKREGKGVPDNVPDCVWIQGKVGGFVWAKQIKRARPGARAREGTATASESKSAQRRREAHDELGKGGSRKRKSHFMTSGDRMYGYWTARPRMGRGRRPKVDSRNET
ncbi:hypothetical protein C8R45DRAFT_1084512 [Mycena sanguinolenta]|nr:hypothetical protein C8R45DRAFT_1084512 [Mycena sanguinolenta]